MMRSTILAVLVTLSLYPVLATAQLSTRTQRAIESCVIGGGSLCSDAVTSISNGGGSVVVDGSGAVDVTATSGEDVTFTLDAAGGEFIIDNDNGPKLYLASQNAVLAATGGSLQIGASTGARDIYLAAGADAQINGNARIATVSVEGFGVGTVTPGGSGTAGTSVLSIANGTEPVTATAGQIGIYSKDSSDGATNATLGLLLEQAVEAVGTFTASHKIKVWINGTEYWLQLDAI